MRKPIFFIAITIFLFGVSPAKADEVLSIKPGFIILTPSGKFSATSPGTQGTRLDMDNDLGLGKSNSEYIEAALHYGDFRLSVSYLAARFSGDALFGSPAIFNGMTFPTGSLVESSLDMDIIDIGLTYYLFNFDDLPVRFQLGPELSVKILDTSVGMKSNALNISEKETAVAPIPTVGLRGRVALADFLGLTARVGGFSYSGNRFVDAEAHIEFSPIPLLGLYAGYRYMDLKVDSSGVFVDTSFSGPVAGAFIRF